METENVSDNSVNEQNQNAVSDSNEQQKSNDVVDYKTHKRLLGQYKQNQKKTKELEQRLAELSEFEQKMSKIEEEKLRSEGNWNKLLEQREEKIKGLSEQLNELKEKESYYKKNLDDMVKLNAFTNALGGKLKKQDYYSFVDTDKIVINPDTGTIDSDSLAEYANEFSNNFKELIEFNSAKLPNDAPKGSKPLSYEEWKALPLGEKKKRQKDVKL